MSTTAVCATATLSGWPLAVVLVALIVVFGAVFVAAFKALG